MVITPKHITKKIVLELPRIYKRGPSPKMILTQRILRIIHEPICDNLAYGVLYELYITKKFSQLKIGRLFNVQRQTVSRWLKRLNIPLRRRVDVVSEALIKYKRTSFSNNLSEKAYLMGLRYGDISTQKHGRQIRIYVSTTHPAMLQLFNNSFKKYGKVNYYPKFNRGRKIYQWCVYVDLDKSFNFLLNKTSNIPRWIINDDQLFFAFLSGYFDSEGCLSIYYHQKDKYGNIQWIIKSSDKIILITIVQKLRELGFNIQYPKLDKKAGTNKKNNNKNVGFPYKKDYWVIQTGIKSQVFSIINKMDLRHEEKIAKNRLSQMLVQSNWKNAIEKIILLRNQIKDDVKDCMEEARIHYNKTHN